MINTITLGEKYANKTYMLNELAKYSNPAQICSHILPKFEDRRNFKLATIDYKVKSLENLTTDEAFHGMCHVLGATNSNIAKYIFEKDAWTETDIQEYLAKGTYFLTLMAFKEATIGLTPEEVAGIVAAGMLDLVVKPKLDSVIETSGMGGDRGWGSRNVKTINASTLSAIVTAACGYKTMKHGSYGNTTKVGSTDVPEMFGANIIQTNPEEILTLLAKTNFWFSDAHSVKTLHYLSHRLMVETINHVVGPMTPPVHEDTVLFKAMGVNHNIHPSIIAKAYTILHKMKILKLGGAVIIGGVDTVPNQEQANDAVWFKKHAFLDEVSPIATILSIAREDEYMETYTVKGTTPFGLNIRQDTIQINNEMKTLLEADKEALLGGELGNYLACNTSIALLARNLEDGFNPKQLKTLTSEALNVIESGKAIETLNSYIHYSGGKKVCT